MTPEECAELMGYSGAALETGVARVIRLVQAHVLEGRWDHGLLLVRPAVVGVSGAVSEELLP